MNITANIFNQKDDLINYFTSRANEILDELYREHGRENYKKITNKLAPQINQSRDSLVHNIIQVSDIENWPLEIKLKSILLVNYISIVISLDYRHRVWPYEYMAFSRRIGELWESFISICFIHTCDLTLRLNTPPLFADVRNNMQQDIVNYIDHITISETEKQTLKSYYEKVWLMVDAGNIKLELDMHSENSTDHFNIDFKSGFGSNEKGNTNRLLVVASIYNNIISTDYRNLMLVRTPLEENNNYLTTISDSGLWEVYCHNEAYEIIRELTSFDILGWVNVNIDWENDLSEQTVNDLRNDNLITYLNW